MDWNLLACADNVVDVTVKQFEWKGYLLVLYFVSLNWQQHGDNQHHPWYI